MGFDTSRFVSKVDEELICAICSAVLEDPIQVPVCEHAFCRKCICEWLNHQQICPIDRQPITVVNLKCVPRILRNMLARLQIKCEYQVHGCDQVITLDNFDSHVAECVHNPQRPVVCDKGCGIIVPMDQLKEHNCIKELRLMVNHHEKTIQRMQQELVEYKFQISQLFRGLHLVKEFMQALRGCDPRVRVLTDSVAISDNSITSLDYVTVAPPSSDMEVLRWANSLPRARVTRWGGMVSTPDTVLKVVIRRSLCESGVPSHILDNLMEHSHERRWPSGLATLETRQTNRSRYECYVCRRVPGKQAVVILTCENGHVLDDMIVEPGLVLIFAHGVETDSSHSALSGGAVGCSSNSLHL